MANTNTAHTVEELTSVNVNARREIADTILRQLGRECLGLLGATNPGVYSDDSGHHGVVFNIKGSRAVNQIYITLEPEDTYKVAFVKVTGGKLSTRTGRYVPRAVRLVYAVTDLFSENLLDTIENRTGIYVSLRPRR